MADDDQPRVRACGCGDPAHRWIAWRGYQLGPLSPDQAEGLLSAFPMVMAASPVAIDPTPATACRRGAGARKTG
jgi:hypothetical protein